MQIIKDLKALAAALQKGDATAAKNALVKLQKDSPSSFSNPFGGTQAGKDLAGVVDALQSGDVSAAQKAFSSFQSDIAGTRKGQAVHSPSGTSTSTAAETSASIEAQLLNNLDSTSSGSTFSVTV